MESQYYSLASKTNTTMLKDNPDPNNLSQSNFKQTPVEDSSSFRTANYVDAENFFQGNPSQINSIIVENTIKDQLLSGQPKQSINMKRGKESGFLEKDTRTTSEQFEQKFGNGVIAVNELGNTSNKVNCPFCSYEAFTEVKFEMRKGAKVFFVFLLITIVLIPFALLVLSMKRFKNVVHECPNCGSVIRKQKYDITKG